STESRSNILDTSFVFCELFLHRVALLVSFLLSKGQPSWALRGFRGLISVSEIVRPATIGALVMLTRPPHPHLFSKSFLVQSSSLSSRSAHLRVDHSTEIRHGWLRNLRALVFRTRSVHRRTRHLMAPRRSVRVHLHERNGGRLRLTLLMERTVL
ncbi:hypothetical protein EI94DRAFT_1757059, partial [Lactarius quietus]